MCFCCVAVGIDRNLGLFKFACIFSSNRCRKTRVPRHPATPISVHQFARSRHLKGSSHLCMPWKRTTVALGSGFIARSPNEQGRIDCFGISFYSSHEAHRRARTTCAHYPYSGKTSGMYMLLDALHDSDHSPSCRQRFGGGVSVCEQLPGGREPQPSRAISTLATVIIWGQSRTRSPTASATLVSIELENETIDRHARTAFVWTGSGGTTCPVRGDIAKQQFGSAGHASATAYHSPPMSDFDGFGRVGFSFLCSPTGSCRTRPPIDLPIFIY